MQVSEAAKQTALRTWTELTRIHRLNGVQLDAVRQGDEEHPVKQQGHLHQIRRAWFLSAATADEPTTTQQLRVSANDENNFFLIIAFLIITSYNQVKS